MKKPARKYTVMLGDFECVADVDYDAGESEWFDHRAGVGSPGYPPSIELCELTAYGVPVSLDDLTQEQIESIEQQVMDQIDDAMREDDAA